LPKENENARKLLGLAGLARQRIRIRSMNIMHKEINHDENPVEQAFEMKIMTLGEVAEMLRLHRSTISRYAKSGELKSYQIGSRRLFRSDDVWLFFENQVAPECVHQEEDL
jgi:excisionase family DNA binding protein